MNPTALKRYNNSRLSLKISSGMSKENLSSVALVVDYIGVSTQLFHSVRSFRCQEFNDLSDHKPIQTILKIKNSFIMEKQPEFETNPARFKWNRDQGAAEEFSKAQDDGEIKQFVC